MARVTRATTRQATAAALSSNQQSGSPAGNKRAASTKELDTIPAKRRKADTKSPSKRFKTEDDGSPTPKTPSKPIKAEPGDDTPTKSFTPPTLSTSSLQAKKLKTYTRHAAGSPFPEFPHPTPEEARLAHRILTSLHGAHVRPQEITAPTSRAGCGDSPSVLDSLVRTILSQNTSDANSTRAKQSMDAVYGGSDNWEAIAAGGTAKLERAIKCGGLSVTKSKAIMGVLSAAKDRYGCYSLDHLFEASNDDAMRELIGFQGVGAKTASCVLLFCLRRETFAVDTHVWRITGLLGWRPKKATRDETHAHLEVKIPDEEKYGLHLLLVKHGRVCPECKAGGKNLGNCELRKAFKEKVKEEDTSKVEPDVLGD
ncbi:uncharacterized protein DNG_07091 [Cephalotrichum gorgonifer]|uniref:4Fe-4S His(Cys)3-ligated-type domain-containing protein n=1 Tax=Cephalotrichum gorgonifer TaxID=2041049 RepID=A0AAE8N118_9PEZI|nr:uncharacterized protein DNG_07091 [Cephalotrichum gorgonifer]